MKPNPFQGITQYFDPLDPNSDPNLPGRPGAGQLPQYTAVPANPFAGVMAGMDPSGFARPEAQQWLQQALAAPNMQGWSQPAPGAGGGAGGAVPGATGAPMSPEQAQNVKNQLRAQGNAQQAGLYGGVLAGAATGGPVGAFTSLLSSALTANKDGFMGSGIDGSWATKTLKQFGYKKGPGVKGYTSYIGPDGKKVGGQDLVVALMDLISTNSLTPKKSG